MLDDRIFILRNDQVTALLLSLIVVVYDFLIEDSKPRSVFIFFGRVTSDLDILLEIDAIINWLFWQNDKAFTAVISRKSDLDNRNIVEILLS